MSAVSTTDVTNVAPELASESTARIQFFIDTATGRVSAAKFGSNYNRAVILLAAHLLMLARRAGSGASGPITQEKVGDLQRSYADASASAQGSDAEYMTTPYGQMYLSLRKLILAGPLVT